MPIDLGLSRVSKLLSYLGNPHTSSYKSVHIAGTNGKGSTIAYLSSILTQSKIRNGRFTSPHMVSYNDCISINDQTYSLTEFDRVRKSVQNHNACYNLGCTEFEILTATAFKIFEIEKVELALIEVGLGGRLDATNVLKPPSMDNSQGGVVVCGITKIAMDHEGFLGDSLKAIAREKAGIIKKEVAVVVDHTNEEDVKHEIMKKANAENATVISTEQCSLPELNNPMQHSPLLGRYQSQNLSVALEIISVLRKRMSLETLTTEAIIKGIERTSWPGRLQKLQDEATCISFLLDGAHNESAAVELGNYLKTIRRNGFIFVIAMSEGKSVDSLLKHITLNEDDAIIPFQFTPPEEMPWVKCYDVGQISKVAQKYVNEVMDVELDDTANLFQFLSERRQMGDVRQIVVCGSLYLCSDILRHDRSTHKTPLVKQ